MTTHVRVAYLWSVVGFPDRQTVDIAQIFSHRIRYLLVVVAIRQKTFSNEWNDLLSHAHHPFCAEPLSFNSDGARAFQTYLDLDHESKDDNY